MTKGKKIDKIDALVSERRKLSAQWCANRREQIRLQHQLDRATTKLMRATGLEHEMSYPPSRLP